MNQRRLMRAHRARGGDLEIQNEELEIAETLVSEIAEDAEERKANDFRGNTSVRNV